MKYECNDCGNVVIEPEAPEEWDCVLCGGQMELQTEIGSNNNKDSRPDWDETPVTLNVIQDILEAHPEYTLTSQIGQDGNRYMMIQFYDEEPNHQASSDFVSMVSELGGREETESDSDE